MRDIGFDGHADVTVGHEMNEKEMSGENSYEGGFVERTESNCVEDTTCYTSSPSLDSWDQDCSMDVFPRDVFNQQLVKGLGLCFIGGARKRYLALIS